MAEQKPKFPARLSLADALKECGDRVPEGMRVYGATGADGIEQFVVSNSPGQAALAVVDVRTVSQGECVTALVAAMNEKKKA